jgi:hypothetical protein
MFVLLFERYRFALIVKLETLRGQVLHLVYTYVSTAPRSTEGWEFISAFVGQFRFSFGLDSSSKITMLSDFSSTNLDSWQLNQLRTMKVGGNQSGTDFFNKKGGSSLLRESDVKKKYSSDVAALYREELARRVQEDAT